MKQRLTVILVLLLATMVAQAQVTIGSQKAPNQGALLDLKDDGSYSNGETASKGFGMPRVNLINLTPTTDDELAISIGATGIWDMDAHIGLVVYNTNISDDICNPVPPIGLYVWDGTQWQGIGIQGATDQFAENINPATGIGTVTDYEGNVYPTKRWTSTDGTKTSGIWMTKNLHSIRKADGTFIDCPNGMRINPAYLSIASGAVVVKGSIPAGTIGNYTNADVPVSGESYADYAREFGLMYAHAQASSACPRGWHLPNDADWNLLAESMNGVKSGATYNGIGHVIKTGTNKIFTSVDGTTYNWTNNIAVTENGFNAVPSGFVDRNRESAYDFGNHAYWWSASTDGSSRYLRHFDLDLYASASDVGRYFSVRCVKN